MCAYLLGMRAAGEVWRLGRRPALDGLRGIAVALVVLSHADVPHFGGAGQVGVTVFFTLSGFLIATLLFEERENSHRISLRRFYRRRLLRLAPALLAVAAVTSLFALATGAPWVTPREVLGAVFYCSNVLALLGPVGGAHMLHHTWSLVIEEQFYLVWPAVTILAWRRRTALLTVLRVAAGGSLALRCVLWDSGVGDGRVLFGTDTRVDGILLGCALAVSLRGGLWPRSRGRGRAAAVTGLAGITFLAVWSSDAVMTVGLTLAALASVMVIVGVLANGDVKLLTLRPLAWLGRRSYGLYLWHHPIAIVLGAFAVEWQIKTLILIPSSLLLTVLSWRCIEKPFLDLRERHSTYASTSARGPATASVDISPGTPAAV